MKQLQAPRELAPIDAMFSSGKAHGGGPIKPPPAIGFETARVGDKKFAFIHGTPKDNKDMRNTFHTVGNTPEKGINRVNFDMASLKNS